MQQAAMWGEPPESERDPLSKCAGNSGCAGLKGAAGQRSQLHAQSWEEVLELRKRPRINPAFAIAHSTASEEYALPVHGNNLHGAALWGEFPGSAELSRKTVKYSVVLLLGCGKELHIADGTRLGRQSAELCALVAAGSLPVLHSNGEESPTTVAVGRDEAVRTIDLRASKLSSLALCQAVRFAVGEYLLIDEALWRGGCPRTAARCARIGEDHQAEDALHLLDMLQASELFGLPQLGEAAAGRLLNNLIVDASVLPILAGSFGRYRAISAACVRHFTSRSLEVLRGRERQLGVLYATHPRAGALVSGMYKAALHNEIHKETAHHPVLVDLLCGPRSASHTTVMSDITTAPASAIEATVSPTVVQLH